MIVVKNNEVEGERECPLCISKINPPRGPQLFATGTVATGAGICHLVVDAVICGSCGAEHAPDLTIVVGTWWQVVGDVDGVLHLDKFPSALAHYYGACIDEHLDRPAVA